MAASALDRLGTTAVAFGLAAVIGIGLWLWSYQPGPEPPGPPVERSAAPLPTPPPPPPAPEPRPELPPAPARISGRVLADVDGEDRPVPDAHLTAVYQRPQTLALSITATISASGDFTVELPAGTFTLIAESDSYAHSAESPVIWVRPGDRRLGVVLVFEAPPQPEAKGDAAPAETVSVRGRVVDRSGVPVPGATLTYGPTADGDPAALPDAGGPILTEQATVLKFGLFEVQVPAAAAQVPFRAHHPRYGTSSTVYVRPEEGNEIVLTLQDGGFITGVVLGPSRIESAVVTLESGTSKDGRQVDPREFLAVPVALTDGRGPFEFGPLEPGRYDLFADSDGYGNGTARRVEVLASVTTEGVVIELEAGVTLRGRVVDAVTNEPIEGAKVVLGDAFRRDRALRARGDLTAADGTWTLPGIEQGPRSLYAKKPGYIQLILAGVDPAVQGEWLELHLQPLIDPKAKKSEFYGVGAVIEEKDGGIRIRELTDDSSAADAGMQVGDRLLTIDGEGVDGIGLRGVVDRLRGQPDSEVRVQVERPGQAAPVTITIPRQRVVFDR